MGRSLTIEKARKLLKEDGKDYSDEQIEKIIAFLRNFGEICYESYKNTQRVQELYKNGYSIEDAKNQLALEGLRYDDRALQLIKEEMIKNEG